MRFDQGRSHVRPGNFSTSSVPYQFLSENRAKYEGLLGKNKDNYFESLFYRGALSTASCNFASIFTGNNVMYTNLPFLLSLKSDAIKYLWFGHQSRWVSLEVQPSSVSRYSLLGLPYLSKNFEFSYLPNVAIREAENYVTRLFKARKNYISN